MISFTNCTFSEPKAFSNSSGDIFFSSIKTFSSFAPVAGLSEITQQYSGILQAKS
jgi:hypothetical protein